MENIINGVVEVDGNFYDKTDLTNLIRLQQQLVMQENALCSITECINIWQRYSNDLSASWLDFPDEDSLIISYIKSSQFFTNFQEYSAI